MSTRPLQHVAFTLGVRSRPSVLWSAVTAASLLLALGCSDQAEQDRKIADTQRQGDERVAKAERECKEKVAALEKQIETIKSEAAATSAQAKALAEDAINKAQASTEEAAKAAETALAKARQAYKEEGRTRLTDLNKEFTEIATKGARIPAKERAPWDKALKDVVTHQKEVGKDLAAFDKATLETFAATKGKLDKDLALMRNALRVLRSKLPKT